MDKLDGLWALKVKDKAGWKCEFCGVQGVRMESAHIIGRRYRFTRWGCYVNYPLEGRPGEKVSISKYDLCGHCLCHNCHASYDMHGPLEDLIVEKTIGRERKIKLQQLANQKIGKYQEFEIIKKILTTQAV